MSACRLPSVVGTRRSPGHSGAPFFRCLPLAQNPSPVGARLRAGPEGAHAGRVHRISSTARRALGKRARGAGRHSKSGKPGAARILAAEKKKPASPGAQAPGVGSGALAGHRRLIHTGRALGRVPRCARRPRLGLRRGGLGAASRPHRPARHALAVRALRVRGVATARAPAGVEKQEGRAAPGRPGQRRAAAAAPQHAPAARAHGPSRTRGPTRGPRVQAAANPPRAPLRTPARGTPARPLSQCRRALTPDTRKEQHQCSSPTHA